MRLAFWRAGNDKPVVQRATARPAPSAPKPAAGSESGDLDLHALGQALMRRRNWIIVPTVLALVASLAAVNMITPRFKSEARILIDGRESVFLRPTGERNEERGALDPEAVTSQVQLVQSRDRFVSRLPAGPQGTEPFARLGIERRGRPRGRACRVGRGQCGREAGAHAAAGSSAGARMRAASPGGQPRSTNWISSWRS